MCPPVLGIDGAPGGDHYGGMEWRSPPRIGASVSGPCRPRSVSPRLRMFNRLRSRSRRVPRRLFLGMPANDQARDLPRSIAGCDSRSIRANPDPTYESAVAAYNGVRF